MRNHTQDRTDSIHLVMFAASVWLFSGTFSHVMFDDNGNCFVQSVLWHHVDRCTCLYADVIKWKHFQRYWPFVRGIHRWAVNSPHKGQWRGAMMFSLICTRNKRLSKQWWGWWFETPSCPWWRHRNVYAIYNKFRSNPCKIFCCWTYHPVRFIGMHVT